MSVMGSWWGWSLVQWSNLNCQTQWGK